jgi:hypothetical protein
MNGLKILCLACVALPAVSCSSGQTGTTAASKAGPKPARVIPVASIRVHEVTYPEYNNSGDIPLAFDGPRCKIIDDTPGPSPEAFYLRITAHPHQAQSLILLIQPKPNGTIDVTCVHKEERWPFFDLIGPNGEVLVEDFETGPRQEYTFPKGSKVMHAN